MTSCCIFLRHSLFVLKIGSYCLHLLRCYESEAVLSSESAQNHLRNIFKTHRKPQLKELPCQNFQHVLSKSYTWINYGTLRYIHTISVLNSHNKRRWSLLLTTEQSPKYIITLFFFSFRIWKILKEGGGGEEDRNASKTSPDNNFLWSFAFEQCNYFKIF